MTTERVRLIRLRLASALLLVQGVLMELSVFVGVIVLLLSGVAQSTITDRVEIFALPYLNDNLYLMMLMSGVFGTLRIVGAIAMARNRMWGLILSLINCVVTLVLMIFLLPPGIVDGLLSGAALTLIMLGWMNRRMIVDERTLHEHVP